MARYDVYRNPSTHSNTTPFLLNVQADLLENLDTCIVIPLRLRESFAAVRLPEDLIPEFLIDGVNCFLETPNMAAVPRKILKRPVLNLKIETHRTTLAIDRLFMGFDCVISRSRSAIEGDVYKARQLRRFQSSHHQCASSLGG